MTDFGGQDDTESRAYAINDKGQVVGQLTCKKTDHSGVRRQAVLWADDKINILNGFDAKYNTARGIDNKG